MNTNQMLQHMIGDSPWVDPENTVDTIKAGDGEKAADIEEKLENSAET